MLTSVLFGLPMGFLSLICYSICCADIMDADDDDVDDGNSNIQILRKFYDVSEHLAQLC